MYIPLDHLYHWIAGSANQPVNIYYFYPHGSKNLADVINIPNGADLVLRRRYRDRKNIFCHDQEPLNFDLYQHISYEEYVSAIGKNPYGNEFLLAYADKKLKNFDMVIDRYNTTLYDQSILIHSEQQSQDVDKYRAAGYIPVHYWSHGVIARDWFRFAAHDQRFKLPQPVTHDFLIYSRDWSGLREYRLKFLELLHQANLVTQSLCYFRAESSSSHYHYTDHCFINSEFSIQSTDLHTMFAESQAESSASADYDVDDHLRTNISVVLETQFNGAKIQLTEKICRALACGHPFLLAAGPGSLQYLRDYGFETFDPWLDESYDTETNSLARLQKIIAVMKKFSNLSADSKHQVLQNLKSIAQRNQQRFFSDEFGQVLTQELQQNLNWALDQADQSNCKKWLDKRKIHKKIFPEKSAWKYPELADHLRLARSLRRC